MNNTTQHNDSSGRVDSPVGDGLKVELLDFDALPESLREPGMVSGNGCGAEYANYIRVTHNGETLILESDAMEPEDARFTRDLKWIKDALMMCYELGRQART